MSVVDVLEGRQPPSSQKNLKTNNQNKTPKRKEQKNDNNYTDVLADEA